MKTKMTLPRLKKVCWCLPLRRGLIMYVYFDLIVVIAGCFSAECIELVKMIYVAFNTIISRKKEAFYELLYFNKHKLSLRFGTMNVLLLAYVLSEVVMAVVGLCGLHTRKLDLIKGCLYYNTLATVTFVAIRILNANHPLWYFDVAILFVYLATKVYFILLLRSLVKKMINESRDDVDDCEEESPIEMVSKTEEETA